MDVWRIGVAISLTNGMSPVLAVITSDLLGLKGKVGEVEKAFSNWNLALSGTMAILAGGAIVAGVAKLTEHGKELLHVQQQMAAAGVNQVDIAKATADSWKVASQYGLKVSDVLADLKEARMVFGSTEHAMGFIGPLEQMRVVLNAVTEGSGNKVADAVYEMARAGELKGLQTPDQFMSYFDQMTKAITASGGKVDPKAFMMATQYGRIASKGWSEDFYSRILPSLIQEMGPSQAGGALMSLSGTIVQGKVSKRSLGMLEDLGLLTDPSKVIYDKLGDPKGVLPGAFANTTGFTQNPLTWAETTLHDALVKKFGDFKPGDPEVLNFLGGAFGNIRSAQAIATLTMEGNRINKDAALIDQAQGVGAAGSLLANDPNTAATNFKNSWDNLLTALGSPLVEPAIQAMNYMANVMKSLTEFANGHPETIKIIGEALVGLGVGLAALGAVTVVAAAAALIPGGAIAIAVAAIGGIIVSIVAYNWHAVVDVFTGIYNAIVNFVTQLAQIPGMIKNAILGGPGVGPAGSPNAPGTPQFKIETPGVHPGKDELYHPTNWVPPANGNQPVTVHAALNVDGRRLAQVVSTHMARNGSWSGSSSSFDGQAMPAPTDVSYI